MNEYALSIDCAKELSMVEGNERGKQARRYFIECEKRLKQQSPFELPKSFAAALKLAAAQAEEIEKQKALNEAVRPKALFTNSVATSDRSVLVSELAKILKQNGVEIGQTVYSSGCVNMITCAAKVSTIANLLNGQWNSGFFKLKKTSITKPDGSR